MEPLRLFIIDDHDVVRQALKARLDAATGVDVVGCTGCWKSGLDKALKLEPDVVLLETKRADGEGLEALDSLADQCSCADVVVLTSYADGSERSEALSRGAVRYLLKEIDTSQLVREIRSLAGK